MSSDNTGGHLESPTRRFSASNRFEIEKVEEAQLNQSNSCEMNETFVDANSNDKNKPALRKTVTHYKHDDSFDFDTIDDKKIEKTKFLPIKKDEGQASCFQVNYDEKNEPTSITCSLAASGVQSYGTCFEDLKSVSPYQKFVAEFLGTLILTLYACSIGLPIAEQNVPSINGCLGGGLTLATLIWCLGNVSGGHFNPSVTIAFLFTGKINPLLTIMYVIAQLLGGFTGATILQNLAPERGGNVSVTNVHPDIHLGQGFLVEMIITFILVLTIFSCVDSRRKDLQGSFPLQIGFAVVVGGLFGGKFTGGSMNPARSFGPALVTGIWENHWVYWIGPISGALIAGLLYQFVLTLKCQRKLTPRYISRA